MSHSLHTAYAHHFECFCIKKVFLSMSHSFHTAYAFHFECFCYDNKNIQNGGHKQCEGYATLKEKLS